MKYPAAILALKEEKEAECWEVRQEWSLLGNCVCKFPCDLIPSCCGVGSPFAGQTVGVELSKVVYSLVDGKM